MESGHAAVPIRTDLFDVNGGGEYVPIMDLTRQHAARRLGRRIGIAAFASVMARICCRLFGADSI